jgi:SOS response regulatory protein OraA/RecX
VGEQEALEAALEALRYRDLSESELERKLADRGFAEDTRSEAVSTLKRTGLLDERRFAEGRARSLAARGAGDAFIRDALERAGVPDDVVDDALAALEPESQRASAIVARRGTDAKSARYLAAKGFAADTIEDVIASARREELG